MSEYKMLAISDTHLGESTSLLNYEEGRQHLEEALRNELNNEGDGKPYVEEVILVGDIPDRTLAATKEIREHTRAFIQMLRRALDIKKLVYVPGNHDHTLWIKKSDGTSTTEPTEYTIVDNGGTAVIDGVDNDDIADLLSVFFEYPGSLPWDEDFSFVIANPLYVRESNGRTYVFTHGTHFKECVVSELEKWAIINGAEVFRITIDPGGDMGNRETLEELESSAAPYIDTLWPSAGDEATSVQDRIWFVKGMLWDKLFFHNAAEQSLETCFGFRCPFECRGKLNRGDIPQELSYEFRRRLGHPLSQDSRLVRHGDYYEWYIFDGQEIYLIKKKEGGYPSELIVYRDERKPRPENHRLFSWDDLREPDNPIRKLTDVNKPMDKSIQYWERYFRRPMFNYLEEQGRLSQNSEVVFVYGDTHRGGYGEVENVRIYNCGSWVVHNAEAHPDCYIFAVDQENEYILDVSYSSEAQKPLLRRAAEDAEHGSIAEEVLSLLVRVFAA